MPDFNDQSMLTRFMLWQEDVRKVVNSWTITIHQNAESRFPNFDKSKVTVMVTELVYSKEVCGSGVCGESEVSA